LSSAFSEDRSRHCAMQTTSFTIFRYFLQVTWLTLT
jgi:hypothetical protein